MPLSGIGFGEMLVIGMLVLIVFGPRRLPEISRSMGKAIREFKRGINEIQRELDVADRESRWSEAGKTAGSGERGSAAGGSRAAGAETGSGGPEPVIAPPALGAGATAADPEAPAPEVDDADATAEESEGDAAQEGDAADHGPEPRAAGSGA